MTDEERMAQEEKREREHEGLRKCAFTGSWCNGYECNQCSVYLEEHVEDEDE